MHRNSVVVLIVSVVATLLLGFWGFMDQFPIAERNGTVFDAFYRAIQLFSIRSGSEFFSPVWQIEIARFMAVAIVTISTIYIFWKIFYSHIRMFRLQCRIYFFPKLLRLFPNSNTPPNHVVICGAGFLGSMLACHFLEDGRDVIVLEKDKENPGVEKCKESGALVFHQDATNPGALKSVRVQDAAMVFALTGSDGLNIDIAYACAEIARGRPVYLPPLACHIHIEDPNLSFALRQWELELPEHDRVHFAFFNLYHVTGRRAAAHMSHEMMKASDGAPVFLIVGLGDFGKSLLVNLVRRWRETRYETDGKITVVVIDKEAKTRTASLSSYYPDLNECCNIIPEMMQISSAEFIRGDFLKDIYPKPLAGIYVCLRDEGDATSVAITLHNLLCNRCSLPSASCTTPPIIIRTIDDHGMTEVIRKMQKSLGWNIHAFPVLTNFCEEKRYGNEISELLAEAAHQDYLEQEYGIGITEADNPSAIPWMNLGEDMRDQNRAQAESLIRNIHEYHYRLVPMRRWDEPYLNFDKKNTIDLRIEKMIEELAIREHDRYMAMKIAQGYRWGPKSDKPNKINETLVPWKELPDKEKDKDFRAVRRLPHCLAQVFFRLEYHPPPPADPPADEDHSIG